MKILGKRLKSALLSGDLRGPSLAVAAKLLAVPIAAAAGLVAVRIVVRALGAEGFAVYALIVGLAALLPFSDLGMGAAVMDAVARRDQTGLESVERVLVTSWRVLSVGAVGLAGASWAVVGFGGWGFMLGTGRSASVEVAAAVATSLYAVGLPLSVGPRMLTGAGKNHYVILIQTASAVASLGMLALAAAWHAPLWGFAAAPFCASLAGSAVSLGLGARASEVRCGEVFRRSLSFSERGIEVRPIAGPMVVITVILAVAYQTDRIVLSHASSLGEVASYSVGFQLFSPLMSLIGSAGVSLWPVYARQRLGGGRRAFVRSARSAPWDCAHGAGAVLGALRGGGRGSCRWLASCGLRGLAGDSGHILPDGDAVN
jgi:O-antigen/teichoic acid export membrane protein